jgi:hypothetical protein
MKVTDLTLTLTLNLFARADIPPTTDGQLATTFE